MNAVQRIKPLYQVKLLMAFPFFGLCFVVLGPGVVSDPLASPMTTFGLGIFALCLPVVAAQLIKEIRFEPDGFVVTYFLRPARLYRYAEVRDLDGLLIRTDRGTINLYSVKNADVITECLLERLHEGQLTGDLFEAHSHMPMTTLIGVALLVVLYVGLGTLRLSEEWRMLGTLGAWIPAFTAVYFMVRGYRRRKYGVRNPAAYPSRKGA
jgi:hypothetical protein